MSTEMRSSTVQGAGEERLGRLRSADRHSRELSLACLHHDRPAGSDDRGLVRHDVTVEFQAALLDQAHRFRGARGQASLLAQLRNRQARAGGDRKSTRLNSSHMSISYAVFCLKKKQRKFSEIDGTTKNKALMKR